MIGHELLTKHQQNMTQFKAVDNSINFRMVTSIATIINRDLEKAKAQQQIPQSEGEV